ncbi:uncharacterized protein LOC124500662 [Dermatophagoides farinae]|nr:uncharacterized protein LOC124500662 [Dermatophagoides farinae]XP_046908102.1 uncharacterized protein LOC124500662 [Dermatophagoides farinae]XP_046908103.1 uncharacterized protein LOC124500662 [Dermatophagoides farinae]XP_046920714.1 uncharacterized protein LOC124500662 [Dermatophagoides farinae]XP_046920715.1 uncharacterized protein LOC124500662 [Dermatophagoides farinae]
MSIYKSNGRKSGYHMTFIWTSNGIIMAIMIGTISASLSSTSQLSSPSPSLSSLQSPSSDMDELPRSLYRNSNYRLRLLPSTTNSLFNIPNRQQQSSLFDDQFFYKIRDRLFMLQPIMLFHNGVMDDSNGNGYVSRKRSCLINAGLSNNCDFRDFISASNARRIWESQASPGKRSSNSLSTYHSYQVPPINRLSYYSSSYPSSYDSSSYKSWLLEQQQQQQQKPSIIDDESMIKNIDIPHQITSSSINDNNGNRAKQPMALAAYQRLLIKRMECLSGLPGGDCENSFLGGESLGQDFLRPGGRNPGR